MGCGYGGKKISFLGGDGKMGRGSEWDARFEIYIKGKI